jgi:hypothetical protein
MSGRGQVVKSDAFQGQSPLGTEELATTSSSAWNAVECASEGLTLFFANASLFIGMTPTGASIVRIDRRLNRVPFGVQPPSSFGLWPFDVAHGRLSKTDMKFTAAARLERLSQNLR